VTGWTGRHVVFRAGIIPCGSVPPRLKREPFWALIYRLAPMLNVKVSEPLCSTAALACPKKLILSRLDLLAHRNAASRVRLHGILSRSRSTAVELITLRSGRIFRRKGCTCRNRPQRKLRPHGPRAASTIDKHLYPRRTLPRTTVQPHRKFLRATIFTRSQALRQSQWPTVLPLTCSPN
jgi:hypothetical protein